MENKFDTDNYPSREPDELYVGARWAWKRPDITSAYPTATYTLKYRFSRLTSTGTVLSITAAKTGSEHVVEVSQTVTGGYTADEYYWQAVVIRDSDSEEVVVDEGFWTLINDLDTDVDTRSHNYKVLVAIRATIEGTASKEQTSYSIAGRSLSRRSPEELMALEREYAQRVKNDREQAKRKSGRSVGSRVLAQFKA